MFSKSAIIVLAASLLPALALASQSKKFASCSGDHHGSYINLWAISGSEGIAQVNVGVSNDSDDPAVFYQVKEISKNGEVLPLKSYSWAIREAIKAEAKGVFYGFIKVTAENASGKKLYINLQKHTGTLRHALAIDGYIEQLTCPVASIVN